MVSAEVTPECLDCLNKNNDKISKCMMCSFKKRAVEETAAEVGRSKIKSQIVALFSQSFKREQQARRILR